MKVLITGAAGLIGRHLSASLSLEHDLILADLLANDADPRRRVLDIRDLEAVRSLLPGVEAVIHLAIASGHEGDYENDAFNRLRFDVNVRGTWNLLTAAVEAGVKRFVQASSLTVVWGWTPPQPVASDAPARPVGTYALTKQMAEAACEHAARTQGLSVICLRIPKPIDLQDERWKTARLRPQWIAMPELVRAFSLALTAPDVGFEIVTITGASSRGRWDLSKAERVLGYRPQMRLEDLGYQLGDEAEPLRPGEPPGPASGESNRKR